MVLRSAYVNVSQVLVASFLPYLIYYNTDTLERLFSEPVILAKVNEIAMRGLVNSAHESHLLASFFFVLLIDGHGIDPHSSWPIAKAHTSESSRGVCRDAQRTSVQQ